MGFVYWYCVKIHEARYKLQVKVSLTEMPAWLGHDQERMNRYKFFLEKGIKHMQSNMSVKGSIGRVPWATFDQEFTKQTLVMRSRKEVSLEEPEENWMYYKEYVAKHGEPGTNGLGHTRSNVHGKDIVIIPGTGLGKLKRSHKVQADLEGEVCNSDAAITGQDQLMDMQESLLAGMFQAPSTGLSLDDLLGSIRGSPPKAASSSDGALAPVRALGAQDTTRSGPSSSARSESSAPWFFDLMGPAAPSGSIVASLGSQGRWHCGWRRAGSGHPGAADEDGPR